MSKRVSLAAVLGLIEAAIADNYMSPVAKLYRLRCEVHDLPTTNESICSDADTISRQAAIEAVHCHVEIKNKIEVMAVQRATAEIIGNIAELPSAEPERKKGQWIRHDEVKNVYGGTCVECSECGEKYVVRHIEDEKYCRNCGADMRGNEE